MCRYNSESGFVLIVVLMALIALSLYTVNSLDVARLEYKMAQHEWQDQQLFSAAQSVLEQAENALLQGKHFSCIVSHSLHNHFFTALDAWKKLSPCHYHVDDIGISLIIEKLQKNKCQAIQTNNKIEPLRQPQGYRINVQAMKKNNQNIKQLQSVVIVASENRVDCESQVQLLTEGRKSWREQ